MKTLFCFQENELELSHSTNTATTPGTAGFGVQHIKRETAHRVVSQRVGGKAGERRSVVHAVLREDESSLLVAVPAPDGVEPLQAAGESGEAATAVEVSGHSVGSPLPDLPMGRRLRSRADMLLHLEALLDQPCPSPNEFALIDKVARLTSAEAPYISAEDLIRRAGPAMDTCRANVRFVLGKAVSVGVLECQEDASWALCRYRLTEVGHRYVSRRKEARISLWRINPGLTLEGVCVILQREGGDSLDAFTPAPKSTVLPVGTVRAVSATAKASTQQRSATNIQQHTAEDMKTTHALRQVHPFWAGLLDPLQEPLSSRAAEGLY
jgi:hypothetical protein